MSLLSTIIVAIGVFLSSSKIFGTIVTAISASVFIRVSKKLMTSEDYLQKQMPSLSVYIICLPVAMVVMQLIIAKPLTQWTRNRAMLNANELIAHLENFHDKFGHYPYSLQAIYKDYFPNVAGIEKYHYLPYGHSYNLSFEQPRFILDDIGTKEWLVYNPEDGHRVYSHTSWFLLLSPEELERSQGWYSSGKTDYPHWKYFLFD